MSAQNESNLEAGPSLFLKEPEGEKKTEAILIAAGPEILTIPMPPRPAGVAMAAIVEQSIFLRCLLPSRRILFRKNNQFATKAVTHTLGSDLFIVF